MQTSTDVAEIETHSSELAASLLLRCACSDQGYPIRLTLCRKTVSHRRTAAQARAFTLPAATNSSMVVSTSTVVLVHVGRARDVRRDRSRSIIRRHCTCPSGSDVNNRATRATRTLYTYRTMHGPAIPSAWRVHVQDTGYMRDSPA